MSTYTTQHSLSTCFEHADVPNFDLPPPSIQTVMLRHPIVGAGQSVLPADGSRGAFSRFEAWACLVEMAAQEDKSVFLHGKQCLLRKGELPLSYSRAAQAFNWTEKGARTWLEKLVAAGMIQRREQNCAGDFRGNRETIFRIPPLANKDDWLADNKKQLASKDRMLAHARHVHADKGAA